jgi:hypothetical protein
MSKCIVCKKEISRYAERCSSCAKKGRLNSMFGKKRPDLGKWNSKQKRTGKNNPCYRHGRTYKEVQCKVCGKNLSKHAFYYGVKKCKNCMYKTKIAWNRNKKIGNLKCKHHVDLNKHNNKKSNIMILTNSKHLSLHRLTYLYILTKFGLKGIKKYISWFNKRCQK